MCATFWMPGQDQWSLAVRIASLSLWIAMIYKTQRLFVRRMGLSRLVLAGMLDLVLLILLSRLDLSRRRIPVTTLDSYHFALSSAVNQEKTCGI